MTDHQQQGRERLSTADSQLENYYNDFGGDKDLVLPDQTDEDRATAMREAEVNALVGIGHALMAVAGEIDNVRDQLDGIRLEGIGADNA
jgi:hypothetical protein